MLPWVATEIKSVTYTQIYLQKYSVTVSCV